MTAARQPRARAADRPSERGHAAVRPDRSEVAGRRRLVVATVGLVLLALLPLLPLLPMALGDGALELPPALLLGGAVGLALACAGLAVLVWRLALRPQGADAALASARARMLSRRDGLTGMDNRAGLLSALRRALRREAQLRRGDGDGGRVTSRRRVGVLMLDIDRFRTINETLGQPMGDTLLLAVAARLRGLLGKRERLARVGSDQFVVLVDVVADPAALSALARNILRAFEHPLSVGDRPVAVSISAGGAMADAAGTNADTLLLNAERALRAAKAEGGATYRAYTAEMDAEDAHSLDMPVRLRSALAAGHFTLAFQPVVNAQDGSLIGVEALMRWHDPLLGHVSPADFIPVLEQTGMIVPAGQWVLQEACRLGLVWARRRDNPLTLSVNASPRQFADPDFVPSVARTLEATGFPPTQLQLEVTEGLLLKPLPETLEKLAALVALGVRVAVDDFGIGYSSLAYLKRYPLATLKIDRLFVNDICHDPKDRAIVRAVLELGRGLGLRVVAEGVEDQKQCEVLLGLGCDAMQGYFFSRPVPAPAIDRLLGMRPIPESDQDWPSTTMAMSLDTLDSLPAD